jgi:hypothetical protein
MLRAVPLGLMSRTVSYHPAGNVLALGFGGRVGKGKEAGGGVVRLYSAEHSFVGDSKPVVLSEKLAEAKDAKRPILVMVSRSSDAAAKTAVASLIKDPEFESLARENFVVAAVPTAGEPEGAERIDELLGGVVLPPESVEIIVTDDGRTPLYTESGTEPPHRVVSGLRRFLAGRSRITRSGGESALR